MSGGPAVAIGLLVLGAIVAAFMIVSRRPTTSLTAIPEKSIAVLPFVDMSRRQGAGVLLRRHLRGTAEPAREDSAVAGDGAHLVVRVQGQGDRNPGDRAHAARGERARRLGAQGGQLGADHGAVDQGRHRHAPVVADLRPQARRHLRDPGRDRGGRGQAAQGHAARRGAEGAHDRSRGVRAVPAGRPARTAGHRRGVPAVRRALPQGAGDRSALRPGVGRAGPQLHQRGEPGPAVQQGGVRPSPRGGHEGARDRSGVRAGPRPARLYRDVRRQRPRRRRAALQARAGARSGGPGRAAQQRRAARSLSAAWTRRWRSRRPSSAAIR